MVETGKLGCLAIYPSNARETSYCCEQQHEQQQLAWLHTPLTASFSRGGCEDEFPNGQLVRDEETKLLLFIDVLGFGGLQGK